MAKQEKSAAELYREERKARLAKAAKQNSKGKKSVSVGGRGQSVISIVIVAAIIIGIVSIVLNSFGIFHRGKKIMQVGGLDVDRYEVVYYTNQMYNMYAQYAMYGYLSDFAVDVQPDEQAYTGEVEGIENPTYADFFIHSAKEQLRSVKARVKYAQEKGITLDAAELAEVNSQIAEMKQTANTYGYGYPNFLRSEYGYGKGMTPELYEKILTEAAIAQKVDEVVREDLSAVYTDEKLEEIFLEEIKEYGVVSYRAFTAEDSETAKALAASENEEAFINAVAELDKDAEKDEDKKTVLLKKDVTYETLKKEGNVLAEEAEAEAEEATEEGEEKSEEKKEEKLSIADWFYDEERKAGDTCIGEKTDKGYTVYMVTETAHKVDTSYTYDVRHILIPFEKEEEHDHDHEGETEEAAGTESTEEVTDENAEDKTETEKETVTPEILDTKKYKDTNIYIDVDLETTKDAQLYMEAQDILVKYLEGDKTETSFGELAKEYSTDGNAQQGGIYEAVTEGKMVPEFEGWALAEGREAGDVGIVETEYGYHIMYFIAKDEVSSWSSVIKEEKVNTEFTEFDEKLMEAAPIENYKSSHEKGVKKELKEAARVTKNNYAAYF